MRKLWPILGNWFNIEENGKFSIRKTYSILKGPFVKVPWKNIVCSNCDSPKTVFIARVALQGKLGTKEVVARWNRDMDKKCVLCNTHVETAEHLFFDCQYSGEIWSTVVQWFRFDRHLGLKK